MRNGRTRIPTSPVRIFSRPRRDYGRRVRFRTRSVVAIAAFGLVFGACIVPPPPAPGQFVDRQTDPVVLTGAQVPALANVPVRDVVAFNYAGAKWSQFPVQIDERKTIELNTVYNKPANTTNPVTVTVYADPNTWTGAGDGVLGPADEIAFMAADTSDAAPAGTSDPSNVVRGSRVRLTVTDPRNGHVAYAYLFRRVGTSLDPSANRRYVEYAFALASGAYKTTYKLDDGPNPETSKVTTSFYTRTFHDRWLDDSLTINAGNATGADILDRHKVLLGPGNCGRSEDTFDDAEGAFIANISGPVRAIRSYIGANSGPYTERTHVFYAQREDIVTDLRVHAIPGPVDFFDYSDAARSMGYSNDHNPGDVTIDGRADTVRDGTPLWEKVDGASGALTHVWSWTTDISPVPTTKLYYEDNDVNPTTQCTGDAQALGSSGFWITGNLPNSDPHGGPASTLRGTRTMFYEAPGRSQFDAVRHAEQVLTPLVASAG